MSKIEMLRILINQQLTAAAEEIFGVFGRTIAEYEEEIARSKLEIARQRRLLELSRQPKIYLEGNDTAVSEQPDLNFSLDQKEEDPPHIKVEEEDPWSDQQTSEPNSFVCPSNSAETSQQEDDDASSVPDASGQDVMELDAPACASASETYSNPNGDDVAAVNGQLSGGAAAAASSYVCTACGQVFPQRAQWARHVQTHRKVETKGDRSYTCDICGKRLTRFDGYQKHLRVHTGEKPYCCDLCGRRFSDNSNYKRHFRTHAAQKSKQS
uniref:C2H2-type domain-containing protein n=1 Tax=Oryzias latipes TaxID=8090 RepID=A0A3P9KR88_ORYLA